MKKRNSKIIGLVLILAGVVYWIYSRLSAAPAPLKTMADHVADRVDQIIAAGGEDPTRVFGNNNPAILAAYGPDGQPIRLYGPGGYQGTTVDNAKAGGSLVAGPLPIYQKPVLDVEDLEIIEEDTGDYHGDFDDEPAPVYQVPQAKPWEVRSDPFAAGRDRYAGSLGSGSSINL